MKESFVKQFNEKLAVLEKLTKKCETLLHQEASSRKVSEEQTEEYNERLRFVQSHAEQLKKREQILATRESEVAGLRTQIES